MLVGRDGLWDAVHGLQSDTELHKDVGVLVVVVMVLYGFSIWGLRLGEQLVEDDCRRLVVILIIQVLCLDEAFAVFCRKFEVRLHLLEVVRGVNASIGSDSAGRVVHVVFVVRLRRLCRSMNRLGFRVMQQVSELMQRASVMHALFMVFLSAGTLSASIFPFHRFGLRVMQHVTQLVQRTGGIVRMRRMARRGMGRRVMELCGEGRGEGMVGLVGGGVFIGVFLLLSKVLRELARGRVGELRLVALVEFLFLGGQAVA